MGVRNKREMFHLRNSKLGFAYSILSRWRGIFTASTLEIYVTLIWRFRIKLMIYFWNKYSVKANLPCDSNALLMVKMNASKIIPPFCYMIWDLEITLSKVDRWWRKTSKKVSSSKKEYHLPSNYLPFFVLGIFCIPLISLLSSWKRFGNR